MQLLAGDAGTVERIEGLLQRVTAVFDRRKVGRQMISQHPERRRRVGASVAVESSDPVSLQDAAISDIASSPTVMPRALETGL